LYSPESNYAKEIRKFEAQRSEFGIGERPYVFRPYPMMLHLAGQPPGGMGPIAILETQEVVSEREAAQYRQRGFRDTPLEAIEFYDAQQTEFMKLAAEQNYDVKNKLTPKAGAEVLAAQDAYPGHLPSVPVTPIKPRSKEKD
jgi:hypothetical protein